MDYFALIDRILEHPPYANYENVDGLYYFLHGYAFCERDHRLGIRRITKELLPLDFMNFSEYCRIVLKDTGPAGTRFWNNIILSHSDSQATAYEAFKYIYRDFRDMKVVSCKKAALTEENLRHNRHRAAVNMAKGDDFERSTGLFMPPEYDDPESVYVVELTGGIWLALVEDGYSVKYRGLRESEESALEELTRYFGPINRFISAGASEDLTFEKPVELLVRAMRTK